MSRDDKLNSGPGAAPGSSSQEADLAQTYRELARGEQQATAMEANLTRLESKLDAMLAQFEEDVGSSAPAAGAPPPGPKTSEENTKTKSYDQSKANKSDQQA